MDEAKEYFICDKCGNTRFYPRQSFTISFRSVNFRAFPIYTKETEECWECSKCSHCYTKEEIDGGGEKIKRKYKDESNIS